MTLLLDSAKAIQFEAFNLMQLIVQQEDIPCSVVQILRRNRDSLIEFIMEFQSERGTAGCKA